MIEPTTDSGNGQLQVKHQVLLQGLISRVNDLSEGDLSPRDKLVYVNNVTPRKLLESSVLVEPLLSNGKEHFGISPDLSREMVSAMSKQALDSETLRAEILAVRMRPWQWCAALRQLDAQARTRKPRQRCAMYRGSGRRRPPPRGRGYRALALIRQMGRFRTRRLPIRATPCVECGFDGSVLSSRLKVIHLRATDVVQVPNVRDGIFWARCLLPTPDVATTESNFCPHVRLSAAFQAPIPRRPHGFHFPQIWTWTWTWGASTARAPRQGWPLGAPGRRRHEHAPLGTGSS
jgi:hypothetical protein